MENNRARRVGTGSINLSWPLIIALSACGGGGGGSSSIQTHNVKIEAVEDTVADPQLETVTRKSVGLILISVGRLGLKVTEDESFSVRLDKEFFFPKTEKAIKDQIEYTAVKLPDGVRFIKRGEDYFFEGRIDTPGNYEFRLLAHYPDHHDITLDEFLTVIEFEPSFEEGVYPIRIPKSQLYAEPDDKDPANNPPTVLRDLPDLNLETKDSAPDKALKLDLRRYFHDPEGEALTFTVMGLPQGLSIKTGNPWIYGQPTAPGSYDVTVTAQEVRSDGDTRPVLGVTQSFTLIVMNLNPRQVPVDPGEGNRQMTGLPFQRDIFNLGPDRGGAVHIRGFIKDQDKIYLGEGVKEVWILRKNIDDWHLFADKNQQRQIAVISDYKPKLIFSDFDARSFDSTLEDNSVIVSEIVP